MGTHLAPQGPGGLIGPQAVLRAAVAIPARLQAFAASVPSSWNAASSLMLLPGPAHNVLPPP